MNLTTKQKWIIGGVALVAGGYLYLRHKASSSTASSSTDPNAIDPLTGLPYSQDQQVDPLTGLTYLAEAQQYGSVQAAEAAFSGTAGGGGAGTAGYPSGNVGTGTTGNTGSYATNAAWSQAVVAGLAALGYDPQAVSAALGALFAQAPLTPDQVTIVQAAEAEFGPPPQGSYPIIPGPTPPIIVPPPTPQPGPPPPGPPPPHGGPYPTDQTGTVHSLTTNESGAVKSTDAGQTWVYDGVPPNKNSPQNQTGVVFSQTTGLSGKVATTNGGYLWKFTGA